MKKSLFIMAVSALSLQANAGFWDEVGKAVSILNTVTGGTATTTSSTSSTSSSSNTSEKRPAFAQLTPAQEQKISQVVIAKTGDADLNRAILEAKPTIEGLLRLASCQTEAPYNKTGGRSNTLFAGRYMWPSANEYGINAVIPAMKYQSANQCVTVTTISNWEIKSRSRLDYNTVDKISFKVAYVSEASNEAKTAWGEMRRGDDGQWYVEKHSVS